MVHRVYKIHVGSRNDEKLRDRHIHGGKRGLLACCLPVRKTYIIEARGMKTADKKALAMAGADGISNAIVLGSMLLNSGRPDAESIFDGFFGGR